MSQQSLRALLFASALAILVSPARAVTYTAIVLDMDSFTNVMAIGVSNTSQVGSGYGDATGFFSNALLWSGTAGSAVNLHPAALQVSYATAATSTNQVGYGNAAGGNTHALLWSGTAASVVDLNPPGIDISYAHDVAGSKQIGNGFNTSDFLSHALLWSGTAASRVDLNPAGYTESFGNGISGSAALGYAQVGYGYGSSTSDNNHAILWTGTAASKVDLNPSGFTETYANDVYGNAIASTQVGSGAGSATSGATHALKWSGTTASKVDLNPSGFDLSEALGVSAAGQVGDGFGASTSGAYHALYWNGTSASAIDLHAVLLPSTGYDFVSSQAFAIADNGTIVGVAVDDGLYNHGIIWTPVPDGPPESGVAGDYNNNGTVDAGDYTTWRKGNTLLHNEVATIGSNTPQDYTEWRARSGNPPGSGSALNGTPIPEPTSSALVACCVCAMLISRPRGCHWLRQCL